MSAQEQTAYGGRGEQARRANDRIASRAEQLRFVARVPLLCECGDVGCEELVQVALDEYHHARDIGRSLTAPGH